jgi:redox-sensitive bicupin YhaK (pirin superfamily)
LCSEVQKCCHGIGISCNLLHTIVIAIAVPTSVIYCMITSKTSRAVCILSSGYRPTAIVISPGQLQQYHTKMMWYRPVNRCLKAGLRYITTTQTVTGTAISNIIIPRDIKLVGNMPVKRILPHASRRMVGPFTFLDEMGPVDCSHVVDRDGDIPPHPHIGLATVTYLFDGAFMHRDSVGTKQIIKPHDVNWMVAGKGVVHSERIPREKKPTLHGVQAWVALPNDAEEAEPSFQHFDKSELPEHFIDGTKFHLIAGSAFGLSSPVQTHSKLFYMSVSSPKCSIFTFDPEGQESAFYLLKGEAVMNGQLFQAPILVVFETGAQVNFEAISDVNGMLLGGEPVGTRYIFWNFVSSSKERIEVAKQMWREQKFPKVPEETEFIPLPETPTQVAKTTMP